MRHLDYIIEFGDNWTQQLKDKLLLMVIKAHNTGERISLGVLAELNDSICLRDDKAKIATFHYVGF